MSISQSRLPLIPLPYPLVLLPSARLTFPIPSKQADALIHLFDSSVADPLLVAVPFVQHEGTTSLNQWGVTARIDRFIRPRAKSDEPYLLTLTGITRTRLAGTSPTTTDISDATSPLSRVTVVYPPLDAHSPPVSDIVQDFKAAAIRLLERFAQDTSQSARKRESWARIAHVVDETEPDKAAAVADAIVSAVGAEHADKLGEGLFLSSFLCTRTSERPSSGYIALCHPSIFRGAICASARSLPKVVANSYSVAALLSTESPSLRLQHVTHVLTKQLSIAEVSTKIATAVDESLSKQQKALFLRQQLAVINAELQRLESGNTDLHGTGSIAEDEDDLDALVRRVDALPAGTEVRRVASTEARRLRRIPPHNAEHGILRNYVRTSPSFLHPYIVSDTTVCRYCQLEWLTALPWTPPPPGSETLTRPDFLANAKSQLDADHFGLDKVKRRLTEYLAVVRLHALIAETEQAGLDAFEDQGDKDKEKASKALVRAGEVPFLIPSPTSSEVQGPRKATKAIKAPILLCVSHPIFIAK
jgi:ATP-dependent Lon protease